MGSRLGVYSGDGPTHSSVVVLGLRTVRSAPGGCSKAVITIAIRLRYDYDVSRAPASIRRDSTRAKHLLTCHIFRRSRVVFLLQFVQFSYSSANSKWSSRAICHCLEPNSTTRTPATNTTNEHHQQTKICHIPTSWHVEMLGSGIAMWQICCRIVVSLSVGGVRSRGVRVVEFGSYRSLLYLCNLGLRSNWASWWNLNCRWW